MKRIPHRWINWVQLILDDEDLPFHSKSLALFLSTYMNASHDMAYPAVSTIRGRMGLGSNSTVIKYLNILEDKGYIMTEKRYGNSKIYNAVIPPNHPSITPPVVLHEVDDSITPHVTTVLHDVEPNNQLNNQLNNKHASHVCRKPSAIPPCPLEKILDLYHQILPMCPVVIKLTDARKASIRARWRSDGDNLKFWEDYFTTVSTSRFLTGRTDPGNGRSRPFVADIDFLIKPSTLVKVQEGKYHE